MTNKSSRLIINSIYLFSRLIITLFISLYTSRLILNELGVEDFGIYNVVGGIVSILTFLTGAMSSSTQRFLSFELGKDNNDIKRIFSASINVYSVIIVIVIILSQTIGLWFVNNKLNIPVDKRMNTYWVYQVSVLSFLVAIFSAPYNAALIAYERMKVYAYIGIFSVLTKLILVLMLSFIPENKLVWFSILMLAQTSVTLLLPMLYCKVKIPGVKYKFSLDKELSIRLMSYTGWNLFGNLSAVGFNQGINVLINIFFGPSVNASRAISTQVNSAVLNFSSSLNTAINPQIIKRYSNKDLCSMRDLVTKTSKYCFLLLCLLGIPILFNTKELIYFWLGSIPENSVIFTQLIIIDSIIGGFSGPLMTSIQATGKIKYYQIVVGGLLLLNVPISYVALLYSKSPSVPYYVVIILSVIAFNARIMFTRYLVGIGFKQLYTKVVLRCAIVIIFSLVLIEVMIYKIHTNAIINIFMCASIVLSQILLFGLDSKEKRYILSAIKNKLKK
ncbi:MATE family efflux transporter [Klebsiella quasipneumoniae]|uniref:lipopolysaccharide biosynthesis protein n=1 Tax=Klebsiella quasipneumoniae TaxID=1463165 RepID=UPI00388EF5C1